MTFRARWTANSESKASKTWPIPPSAMACRMRKRPQSMSSGFKGETAAGNCSAARSGTRDNSGILVCPEKELDFGLNLGIAARCQNYIRLALTGAAFQRSVKDVIDSSPAILIHPTSGLRQGNAVQNEHQQLSSLKSQALAMRQSRLTVRAEIPRA